MTDGLALSSCMMHIKDHVGSLQTVDKIHSEVRRYTSVQVSVFMAL